MRSITFHNRMRLQPFFTMTLRKAWGSYRMVCWRVRSALALIASLILVSVGRMYNSSDRSHTGHDLTAQDSRTICTILSLFDEDLEKMGNLFGGANVLAPSFTRPSQNLQSLPIHPQCIHREIEDRLHSQCRPVYTEAIEEGGSTLVIATVASDGPASQHTDSQPTAASMFVTQISDGQPQTIASSAHSVVIGLISAIVDRSGCSRKARVLILESGSQIVAFVHTSARPREGPRRGATPCRQHS